MRVFRPKDPSKAVIHHCYHGPDFSRALAVVDTMNNMFSGWSAIEGNEEDDAQYCVPADSEGNSILTGENVDFFGIRNTFAFTCTGLEVFLI